MLAVAVQAQETGKDKPKRPLRPDPGKHAPLEVAVKLPDDFVQFTRVPDGGLRPRVGIAEGQVALIYSKGEALGDLFFTRTLDEGKTFAPSVRLNPTAGTVLAWNETQSASLDIGPDGRTHVTWIDGGDHPSVRYVRTSPDGVPEDVLDLGAPPELGTTTAITVDAEGRVFVFYSAAGGAADVVGNPGARIYLRRCLDGTTFTEAVPIDPNLNVSTHSDLAAHVDEVMGTIFLLYRTAFQVKETSPIVSRSMRLLSSLDHGETFDPSLVDNWKHQRDPHSSANLSQEKSSTLAAWDLDGGVCWSIIRRQLRQANLPLEAKSETPGTLRNHAVGSSGGTEVILTWLERPEEDPKAEKRLGWEVWMREGRISLGKGFAPEPATGDGQAVIPRSTGGFTILY